MDQIPIGAAAKLLGTRTSTLRYYEERGLVRPSGRVGGKRVYGHDELRRLAYLRMAHWMGIRLDTAAAVMNDSREQWRAAVGEQITELDELIAQAQGARTFLQHALTCPADHPVGECPYIMRTLDRLLEGTSFEQLASEHTDE